MNDETNLTEHALWIPDADALTVIAAKVHANAVEHGFWGDDRNFGEAIALCHSELSEALEAHRHGDHANMMEELADTVIRIMDLAAGFGSASEFAQTFVSKHAINIARPHKHGKNY